MPRGYSLLLLSLGCAAIAAEPRPVLYLPLDGTAQPTVAQREVTATAGPLGFEPGRVGQAVRLTGDLRLSHDGWWPAAAGTFACWVRLREPGQAPQPRYLVCLYGDPAVPNAYQHNRFSVYATSGQMHFSVWGVDGKVHAVQAPIGHWAADTWHHVAVTWQGCLEGEPAAIQMYLDGALAKAATGLPIAVGPTGPTVDVGRDSDGSPDYLDGLLDEVYVYDVPLPEATIAAAVTRPVGDVVPVATPAGEARPDWWHTGWRFRVPVELPARDIDRLDQAVELPVEFVTDAGRLAGLPAALDPSALRVVLPDGTVTPASLADGRVTWRWPGPLPAGQTATARLYFRLLGYDLSQPLAARPLAPLALGSAPPTVPDYATEVYGQPWDFSDGFSGIDQWGDKPEYIEREVRDGVLSLRVKQDPFFIWGDMWGQSGRVNRPVDIDLGRYHVLELRLRQSVRSAEWSTFGRLAGTDRLIKHDFTVTGDQWQTVRVDLAAEARWQGRLSAFRIDPTNLVEATVEIDWVRLLAVATPRAGDVVSLGEPTAPTARVELAAAERTTVGQTQTVTVTVRDAAGQPVAGQPVLVELAAGSDGSLAAAETHSSAGREPRQRRGLTDASGRLEVGYRASERAGAAADRLVATAEFSTAAPAEVVVATIADEPAKLVLSPRRPVFLPAGETALELTVQVADSFGNPLAAPGHVVSFEPVAGADFVLEDGRTDGAGQVTATLRLDPTQRWVVWPSASDDRGLSGQGGAVCYTPSQRDWGVTIGEHDYFVTPAGEAWLPLGGFYANWVGDVPAEGEPGRRLTSFVDTSDAEKIAWLRFLAEQGVNALRFMLRAHRPGGMEPMDIGGRVNPELYAEALHYMDLARPFGIRFLLVLHEDYTKPVYLNHSHLERFCLPRWDDTDLASLPAFQRRFLVERRLYSDPRERYTEPDAMACQDLYVRELVGLLKENPQVFAYELENEQVAVPASWVNHQCAVIREVDPRTPICMSHGGGGMRTGDPLYWRRHSDIDFYTYHLYPNSTIPDGTDYGLAVDTLVRYGRLAGRCFLGESVGDEWGGGAPEDMRRRVARDVIWFSLVQGNPGVMFWNQRGWEVEEFALARRLVDRIDWATWARRPASIGVDVTHPLDDDVWFRTPAGGAAVRAMSAYTRAYLDSGGEFDFVWGRAARPTVVGLDPVEPPPAPSRPVQPPAGFQAAAGVRADGSEGLAYVRCYAGEVQWTSEERQRRSQLVRTVAARPCQLQLDLGAGQWQVTVIDLSSRQESSRMLPGDAVWDLGTTDSDLVVWWRRAR